MTGEALWPMYVHFLFSVSSRFCFVQMPCLLFANGASDRKELITTVRFSYIRVRSLNYVKLLYELSYEHAIQPSPVSLRLAFLRVCTLTSSLND